MVTSSVGFVSISLTVIPLKGLMVEPEAIICGVAGPVKVGGAGGGTTMFVLFVVVRFVAAASVTAKVTPIVLPSSLTVGSNANPRIPLAMLRVWLPQTYIVRLGWWDWLRRRAGEDRRLAQMSA